MKQHALIPVVTRYKVLVVRQRGLVHGPFANKFNVRLLLRNAIHDQGPLSEFNSLAGTAENPLQVHELLSVVTAPAYGNDVETLWIVNTICQQVDEMEPPVVYCRLHACAVGPSRAKHESKYDNADNGQNDRTQQCSSRVLADKDAQKHGLHDRFFTLRRRLDFPFPLLDFPPGFRLVGGAVFFFDSCFCFFLRGSASVSENRGQ